MQIEITPEYLASQHLSKTFPKRFWKRVHKTDGCWLWIGETPTGNWGHKRAVIYGGVANKHQSASRASWMLHYGPIPVDKEVCHTCDNGICVRPDHLWLGTHKENMHDMINKGRRANTAITLRGENNPDARMTNTQAREAFEMLTNGVPKAAIARRFGVSETAIRHMETGRNWKYLSHADGAKGLKPAEPATFNPPKTPESPASHILG